jgi:predicted CXXCH cytochrome family protein
MAEQGETASAGGVGHGDASSAGDHMPNAVCSDCHTPHSIDSPEKDPVKLMITENCGTCHADQVRTYEASYHGQVIRAGYTHTAKCYDCHGSHGVMDVDDPASKVHPTTAWRPAGSATRMPLRAFSVSMPTATPATSRTILRCSSPSGSWRC